jgi:hypothetical protein
MAWLTIPTARKKRTGRKRTVMRIRHGTGTATAVAAVALVGMQEAATAAAGARTQVVVEIATGVRAPVLPKMVGAVQRRALIGQGRSGPGLMMTSGLASGPGIAAYMYIHISGFD